MYPDVESLLVAYLSGRTGYRVVTELPEDVDQHLPIIRVNRVSGTSVNYKCDHPIVDVDVFAADRPTAHDLSEEMRSMLYLDLPTVDCVQPSGVVAGVTVLNGPRWLPDKNTHVRRYQASYQLVTHA